MDQWQSGQVEQLRAIGPYLKEQREERGLTVQEVAEKTRIRPGLIRALEAAQPQELPEPVYLRGFVKRYAELMGLDGDTLASRFQLDPMGPIRGTATAHIDIPPSRKRSWVREGITALVALANTGSKAIVPSSKSRFSLGKSVLTGSAIVVGLGLGGALIYGVARQWNAARTLDVSPTPTPVREPTPAASPPPTPTPSPSPRSPAALPLQFEIEVRDLSWMQVMVDGEVAFEGEPAVGDRLSWTAQKSLTLTAGRPEALWISVNGSPGKPFGEAGEPKEETFP